MGTRGTRRTKKKNERKRRTMKRTGYGCKEWTTTRKRDRLCSLHQDKEF